MSVMLRCAALSSAVYRLELPDGFDGMEVISRGDTIGAAYFRGAEIYFAFQGSTTKAHWLSNIRVIKTRYHGIRAHQGFAEAAMRVADDVRRIALGHAAGGVWFTGHSLGGAIALLTAMPVSERRRCSVITFGQPRVSTLAEIRSAFSGEYLRVVNGSDAVVRRPALCYSHAGTELYLSNSGKRFTDPCWFKKMADRTITISQHERIFDHSMQDYLRELGQCES